jgi:hypothetical protein
MKDFAPAPNPINKNAAAEGQLVFAGMVLKFRWLF